VPQDIHLFGSTLFDNINLESGAQSSSTEVSDLEFFKLGFDEETRISNLSGGQKQRISLMRANLNNSKIILLDEPTSALDSAGEKEFQMWLESIKVRKLIFIVAHRVDTLKQADFVVYIEKGKIVHVGTLETSQIFISRLQADSDIF
jgi:ABC-type multidrug transport system fused ATPase/permease subunit